MKCAHDSKVAKVEVEFMDTMEVREMAAAGCLGEIRLREEGEGEGMARLEKTGILSGELSPTDLPELLSCLNLHCGIDNFYFH